VPLFSHLLSFWSFTTWRLGALCYNAESRDADTKAHGLSVQQKGRSEDDILLSINAAQITTYLAATGEAKKWKAKHNKQKKKAKRQHASTTSSSDDDSEQPEKRQRVEQYCYCHGTQYSHTSMVEGKVMEADKKRFTHAMRKTQDPRPTIQDPRPKT
jgi:hypothetical protein